MSSSVHRISVREINEIRYQRQLAVLNRLFRQWQAISEKQQNAEPRKEQITTTYQALVKNSQQVKQLTAKQLTALNQEVASFSVSLNNEIRHIREQLIDQQAHNVRSQFHRQRNLVELSELIQRQVPHEIDLINELNQNISSDLSETATLISRAFSVLESKLNIPSQRQNELLNQLKAQSDGVIEFWRSGVPQSPFMMQCEQISLMIEKLKVIGLDEEATIHSRMLLEIQVMTENAQRHVRADSLIMTIATQLRKGQKRIELAERLEQISDELASFKNAEFTEIIQETNQLAVTGTLQQLALMITQLEEKIEQAEQQIVIRAQREAVLEGLSKLGYEIRENSVTSWLEDGQVVVTHPAIPGYGLELGGKQTRFQARTVAFSAQRDTQRDQDIDAIWCSQHQKLQDILVQSDAELTIDRALPAGNSEMKVIEVQNQNEQVRQQSVPVKSRTLR
ncbi:hypothetical protein M2263_000774 [Providencia alcalifaciens]|nr:hypothetical protein [Providencia alcalifaciens]